MGAAEGQEAFGQRCAAIGRALDRVSLCPFRIVRFEHHRQQVRGAEDRGEHVVEIVRDPAGEPADGFHFLRLAQLILEREPRGDVARDCLHADRLAVFLDDLYALPEPQLTAILCKRRKLEIGRADVLRALTRVELGRTVAIVLPDQ